MLGLYKHTQNHSKKHVLIIDLGNPSEFQSFFGNQWTSYGDFNQDLENIKPEIQFMDRVVQD